MYIACLVNYFRRKAENNASEHCVWSKESTADCKHYDAQSNQSLRLNAHAY
jgi:hypothetical protein